MCGAHDLLAGEVERLPPLQIGLQVPALRPTGKRPRGKRNRGKRTTNNGDLSRRERVAVPPRAWRRKPQHRHGIACIHVHDWVHQLSHLLQRPQQTEKALRDGQRRRGPHVPPRNIVQKKGSVPSLQCVANGCTFDSGYAPREQARRRREQKQRANGSRPRRCSALCTERTHRTDPQDPREDLQWIQRLGLAPLSHPAAQTVALRPASGGKDMKPQPGRFQRRSQTATRDATGSAAFRRDARGGTQSRCTTFETPPPCLKRAAHGRAAEAPRAAGKARCSAASRSSETAAP